MGKSKLTGIIVACTLVIVVVIVLVSLKPWERTPPGETCTLTTNVSPSGAGSVSPSGGTYGSGTQVTLIASPASGYRFDHWGGDASGTSPTATIAMTVDHFVTANFAIESQHTDEGTSTQDAISIGSPLTVTFLDGSLELTVLDAWYQGTESSQLSVQVQVRIRAITDVEYDSWQFKAVGSQGVLYQCSGIPAQTQITAGTIRTEELRFHTDQGDTGQFFLVWDGSTYDLSERRYFSLQ